MIRRRRLPPGKGASSSALLPARVALAVPKTGHMTELMAQAAARNIAAEFTAA